MAVRAIVVVNIITIITWMIIVAITTMIIFAFSIARTMRPIFPLVS